MNCKYCEDTVTLCPICSRIEKGKEDNLKTKPDEVLIPFLRTNTSPTDPILFNLRFESPNKDSIKVIAESLECFNYSFLSNKRNTIKSNNINSILKLKIENNHYSFECSESVYFYVLNQVRSNDKIINKVFPEKEVIEYLYLYALVVNGFNYQVKQTKNGIQVGKLSISYNPKVRKFFKKVEKKVCEYNSTLELLSDLSLP